MHSCRGSTGLYGIEETGLMHKAKIIHEAEERMTHKVAPLAMAATYIFPNAETLGLANGVTQMYNAG